MAPELHANIVKDTNSMYTHAKLTATTASGSTNEQYYTFGILILCYELNTYVDTQMQQYVLFIIR